MLDLRGDHHGLDELQVHAVAVLLHPSAELPNGLAIGHPSVLVTNLRGKEPNEVLAGLLTSLVDQGMPSKPSGP